MPSAMIGFAYTGEDPLEVAAWVGLISSALLFRGYEPYSTFDDEDVFVRNEMNPSNILHHAVQQLLAKDLFVAIVTSEKPSLGMYQEVGALLASGVMGRPIPFVLLIRNNVLVPYLRRQADLVIEFDEPHDLWSQLCMASFPSYT